MDFKFYAELKLLFYLVTGNMLTFIAFMEGSRTYSLNIRIFITIFQDTAFLDYMLQ